MSLIYSFSWAADWPRNIVGRQRSPFDHSDCETERQHVEKIVLTRELHIMP